MENSGIKLKEAKGILLYEKNAKKHPQKQIEQIANSIKEFGFNQPLVIDNNNVLIIGHGRLAAANLLGLEKVPTITVDLTEEQAKAYRLADNKLNESEWEMSLVIDELKSLSDEMVELTGFDKDILSLEFNFRNDELNIEKLGTEAREYQPKVCPNCKYEF